MKKRNLLLVILAVLLVFGMVMGCGPTEDDEEEQTPVVEPEDDWGDGVPDSKFFGTYETEEALIGGIAKNIEKIVFNKDSFKISDKSASGDFLEFAIDYYDEAPEPPAEFKSFYPNGMIFKGYITNGKPIGTNIYGSKTAPGLGQTDIDNKTYCKMIIYYSNDAKVKFIRTAFAKANASNGAIITNDDGTTARVYIQQ